MFDHLLKSGDMLDSISTPQMDLLPTPSLTSLTNTAAQAKSQLTTHLRQAQTRVAKIKGEITMDIPDMGKVVSKVKASAERASDAQKGLFSPVEATTSVIKESLEKGEPPFDNIDIPDIPVT